MHVLGLNLSLLKVMIPRTISRLQVILQKGSRVKAQLCVSEKLRFIIDYLLISLKSPNSQSHFEPLVPRRTFLDFTRHSVSYEKEENLCRTFLTFCSISSRWTLYPFTFSGVGAFRYKHAHTV